MNKDSPSPPTILTNIVEIIFVWQNNNNKKRKKTESENGKRWKWNEWLDGWKIWPEYITVREGKAIYRYNTFYWEVWDNIFPLNIYQKALSQATFTHYTFLTFLFPSHTFTTAVFPKKKAKRKSRGFRNQSDLLLIDSYIFSLTSWSE